MLYTSCFFQYDILTAFYFSSCTIQASSMYFKVKSTYRRYLPFPHLSLSLSLSLFFCLLSFSTFSTWLSPVWVVDYCFWGKAFIRTAINCWCWIWEGRDMVLLLARHQVGWVHFDDKIEPKKAVATKTHTHVNWLILLSSWQSMGVWHMCGLLPILNRLEFMGQFKVNIPPPVFPFQASTGDILEWKGRCWLVNNCTHVYSQPHHQLWGGGNKASSL